MLLAEKIGKFNQRAQEHLEKQRLNPFSGSFSKSRSPSPRPGEQDYGRPVAGSKTEQRGIKAKQHVNKEILELCGCIHDLYTYNRDHKKNDPDFDDEPDDGDTVYVTFGELFQVYTQINNKVVGLLIAAKKKGLVYFEGEMLFQRRDDDVLIALIKPIEKIRAMMAPAPSPVPSPSPSPVPFKDAEEAAPKKESSPEVRRELQPVEIRVENKEDTDADREVSRIIGDGGTESEVQEEMKELSEGVVEKVQEEVKSLSEEPTAKSEVTPEDETDNKEDHAGEELTKGAEDVGAKEEPTILAPQEPLSVEEMTKEATSEVVQAIPEPTTKHDEAVKEEATEAPQEPHSSADGPKAEDITPEVIPACAEPTPKQDEVVNEAIPTPLAQAEEPPSSAEDSKAEEVTPEIVPQIPEPPIKHDEAVKEEGDLTSQAPSQETLPSAEGPKAEEITPEVKGEGVPTPQDLPQEPLSSPEGPAAEEVTTEVVPTVPEAPTKQDEVLKEEGVPSPQDQPQESLSSAEGPKVEELIPEGAPQPPTKQDDSGKEETRPDEE